MLSNVKISESVPAEIRRGQLERRVAERGFLRVSDAALELGVSSVTVRADLAALSAEGRVQRVHGGAMPIVAVGESSFEANVGNEAVAKRAIGRAAAGLVASGNSVLLDVGSTALAVAHALVDRHDLTDVLVITNGLTIALALEAAMPRFTIVVTGGTLRPLQHSLVSPFAMLDLLRTDIAFIGCNGVDVKHGVTNINLPEAEVKRRMVASSKRAVVIADGSKLGAVSLGLIGSLDEFDSIVTTGDTTALEGSRVNVVNAT